MQFAGQIKYLVDRNCQIFFIKIFDSCSLFIQIIKLQRATSKSATERVNVAKYLSGDRHSVVIDTLCGVVIDTLCGVVIDTLCGVVIDTLCGVVIDTLCGVVIFYGAKQNVVQTCKLYTALET